MRSASKHVSRCNTRLEMAHSPSDGKREPEDEEELESVVEREPVNSANGALKNSQEGKDHPVL